MAAYEIEKYYLCLERQRSLSFIDQVTMWINNERLECPTPEMVQMTVVRNLIQTGTVLAVEICVIVTWQICRTITRKIWRFFRPVEDLYYGTPIIMPENQETAKELTEAIESHQQDIALQEQVQVTRIDNNSQVNADLSRIPRFISWLSSRNHQEDSSYISKFLSWFNAEKRYPSPKSIFSTWFVRGNQELNPSSYKNYDNQEGKLRPSNQSCNESKYAWLYSLRSRISSMVSKLQTFGQKDHTKSQLDVKKKVEQEERFEDALEEDTTSLKILYEYIKYGVLPKYSVDHLLKILEEKAVPLPEMKSIIVDIYRIALKKRAAPWGLTLRSRARKIFTARPFRRSFPPGKLYGALGFKRKRDRFFDAFEEIPEDELNAGDQTKGAVKPPTKAAVKPSKKSKARR